MQFEDKTLPTLDTSLWVDNEETKFKFFEKPTVGNQVLGKDTALPTSCIRASLLQEVVHRLLNCSPNSEPDLKRAALDTLAQKLVNSGHSQQSTRILLVQGVTNYLYKVKCLELEADHTNYEPLYKSKRYKEEERQTKKFLARANWYKKKEKKELVTQKETSNMDKPNAWKNDLQGVWKGSSRSQKSVKNMTYTTILKVPSSPNSTLLYKLVGAEDRLAIITGYNLKLVEQSGIQLARLFSRAFTPKRCHWSDCPTCGEHDGKGSSKCKSSNLVYEGVCLECMFQVENGLRKKDTVGRYIGESSRTLSERSREHCRGAKAMDPDNFIIKHWALQHSDLDECPKMRFKVIKTFNDPLSRLISESVWIDKMSNMNSKSEWRCNKMSRLVVETPA